MAQWRERGQRCAEEGRTGPLEKSGARASDYFLPYSSLVKTSADFGGYQMLAQQLHELHCQRWERVGGA